MRLVPIDGHLHQRIQAISGGCGRVVFLPINKKQLDRLFHPNCNSSTGKCNKDRASKNQTNKELTDRTSCERWIAFQVSSLVALGDMLFTPGSGFVARHRFQAGLLSAFRLLRFWSSEPPRCWTRPVARQGYTERIWDGVDAVRCEDCTG